MSDELASVSAPITNSTALHSIAKLRKTSRFSFALDDTGEPNVSVTPSMAFEVVFARRHEPVLRRRIELAAARGIVRHFDNLRSAQQSAPEVDAAEELDGPGYIYCFRDLRDPPDVLKIGRTNRTPRRRLAEWREELGADRETLVLLFAYRTRLNSLAERLVRESLRCFRIHDRFNPTTGRELTEFYRIDNALAASLFVRATTSYVDRLYAAGTKTL
jgi:T5orf172 domain